MHEQLLQLLQQGLIIINREKPLRGQKMI